VCAALQFDEEKEWPSIVGEHFDSPQPKFDFRIIDKTFDGMGYINYKAYSLTIPPEYLHIIQVSTRFKFKSELTSILRTQNSVATGSIIIISARLACS